MSEERMSQPCGSSPEIPGFAVAPCHVSRLHGDGEHIHDVVGKLRPGWLIDDQTWWDQFTAMIDEDRQFLAEQWKIAGGLPPAVDTSWLMMESIGGPSPAEVLRVLLLMLVVIAGLSWLITVLIT